MKRLILAAGIAALSTSAFAQQPMNNGADGVDQNAPAVSENGAPVTSEGAATNGASTMGTDGTAKEGAMDGSVDAGTTAATPAEGAVDEKADGNYAPNVRKEDTDTQ